MVVITVLFTCFHLHLLGGGYKTNPARPTEAGSCDEGTGVKV